MKKVILIFPDTVRMAHFVITYSISNAEANTKELSLYAYLTEDQIALACTLYNAYPSHALQIA